MSEGTANVPVEGAPTTFVLIPGAGADPRVYGQTIAALRELGHEGIAPPLPLDDPAATPSDRAEVIVIALGDPPPAPLVVVGLEIEEMPGGHLPFLSRPGELAERRVALA